jgi:hypothetical protein
MGLFDPNTPSGARNIGIAGIVISVIILLVLVIAGAMSVQKADTAGASKTLGGVLIGSGLALGLGGAAASFFASKHYANKSRRGPSIGESAPLMGSAPSAPPPPPPAAQCLSLLDGLAAAAAAVSPPPDTVVPVGIYYDTRNTPPGRFYAVPVEFLDQLRPILQLAVDSKLLPERGFFIARRTEMSAAAAATILVNRGGEIHAWYENQFIVDNAFGTVADLFSDLRTWLSPRA